jgi:hypothetical protein
MKFVDKVPETGKVNNYTKIQQEVELLKERPGNWALVREAAHASTATSYKKYGCLVTARITSGYQNLPSKERRYDIYACWPRPVQLDPPRKPRPRKTV